MDNLLAIVIRQSYDTYARMTSYQIARQSLLISEAEDRLRQLLAASTPLLGPCTPLPALYEEVLRCWRGRSTASRRLQQAQALLGEIHALPAGLTALAEMISESTAPLEMRLLAATLWAMATPSRERVSLPDDHSRRRR